MKLTNFFKKEKKEIKEKKAKVIEKKEVKAKEEKPVEIKPPKTREKRIDLAWKVLKYPHISEKATNLVSQNQYVFKVFNKINKTQIKKAVEDLFGVDVVSVKTINVLPKKRRIGKVSGYRKGYKKAIVEIKEGQKIEIMPR